jgi:lysophospholipase L1-like esterase
LTNRWLRKLDDLIPIHRKYVSIVREVAKAEDVALCDLAGKFEKLPRDYVFNKCFMSDGIHLVDHGNVIIADMLFKCFEKKGLLKQILE